MKSPLNSVSVNIMQNKNGLENHEESKLVDSKILRGGEMFSEGPDQIPASDTVQFLQNMQIAFIDNIL